MYRIALILILFVGACARLPGPDDPIAQLRMVETVPDELALGSPGVLKTEAEWMDMISKSRRSLDISQFYVQTLAHSGLDRVLRSMESAAQRGIKIRFLVDEAFVKKYPNDTGKTMEGIRKWPGTEVRITNRWAKNGGIQHSKYFIVDSQDAFLGSQNFDWRALDHIAELGFRFRSPPLVASLQAVFEDDWAKADNQEGVQDLNPKFFQPAVWQDVDGAINTVALKVSPNPDSHNPGLWDLPAMLQMLREAKKKIRLTAMLYKPSYHDKSSWLEVDNLLIEAARRGVQVQVMTDNRNKAMDFKNLLEAGVEVGLVKIPTHSSGPIPHARLLHAKYVVVDDQKSWLGTSNFEGDYFYHSRNLSLIFDSPRLSTSMGQIFDRYWTSSCIIFLKPELP